MCIRDRYDVASLLWQAKANLPDEWKRHLLNDYMDSFEAVSGKPMDRDLFQSQYHGYVLIRLLQVLGAYGFRGLFERKAHFPVSYTHLDVYKRQYYNFPCAHSKRRTTI